MNNVSSSNSQKALVPELRFPEFTDTWKTDLIGNIGSFTKGAGLSKADITENGTPFILYGELYTTYGDVIYDIKRKTNKAVSEECYSKVGDVIIPTSGETPEEIATSACVMIPDVILAGDLNILRSSNIDGRFLSYLINHVANKSIAKIAQGKSVVHIQAKEISKIAINFPSSAEQLRIVNLLELLDAKISKQEDLIKGLKLYKRGVENTLFDEIEAQSCEYIGIDNAVDSIPTSKHQIPSSEYKSDGLYPVIDQGKRKIVAYSDDSIKLYYDIPAIIYGDHTTNIKYMDTPFILGGDGTKLLKPRNNANIKYLYYALAHYNVVQEGYKRHFPILKTKLIPVPNNDTQIVVSSVLSVIDNKIEANESLLDKFSLLKKSLLQKMFI